MCGLQGSGKSTYVRDCLYDTHVRLNLDMLRSRSREDTLLHACLAAKVPFVVDNTNLRVDQRKRYVDLARAAGYASVQLVWVRATLDEALARNAERTGKKRVPDAALRGAQAKFEAPTQEEGFDRASTAHRGVDGSWTLEEVA